MLLSVIILNGCQEYEKKYYSNNVLESKIPVENGVRNGKAYYYSKDGKLEQTAIWSDGELNGQNVFFFENGDTSQVNHFRNGVICCESRFYSSRNRITEYQFFDERGVLIDYLKYNSDGKRNFETETRMPLLYSKSDTINKDDYFELEIRLGNKKYDKIEVIVGSSNYDDIADSPRLPNIDPATAVYRTSAHHSGQNVVNGFILEMNKPKPDTVLTIPFTYRYFVVDSQKNESEN